MALLFINKVQGDRIAFEKKVRGISYKLGINANWLMFLIDFESAGTFSESIQNSFDCTGLIQFCADSGQSSWKYEDKFKTINGKKYFLKDIKAMSNVGQLDLVYEYLKSYKGKMSTFYDLYFAILFPNALGQEDNYVINTGTNPIFDLNKNGTITVGEVKDFLNDRVNKLVPSDIKTNFFDKNSQAVKNNIVKIYQREIIILLAIILLLIALFFVGKKIFK